ncbi:MAG: double-strand break repair helicase AddA [Bauldia sp.]|nr:double-strand break repair helicase AddA [Bauldia sp.]
MVRPASHLSVDEATRKAQADASDPRASAWVSANAGSGKTHVLAYRVIRLLLAGADPGRILCLTFTRAAAAEMAKRVFDILAGWTAMSDAKLGAEIRAIEGRKPDSDTLAEARRLFARALETPGGLKIQTIHAFCERLLHQFPFEANVAGHFEVLDQRDAEALAVLARQKTLAKAADDASGPLGKALHDALAAASDFMVERAMTELINGRDRLRRWLAAYDSLDDALLDLQAILGLEGGEDVGALQLGIIRDCPLRGDLAELVERLSDSGKNDRAAADRLRPALGADTETDEAEAYLAFWTRGDGELRAARSLVSNGVEAGWPGLDETLDAERERLEALLGRIRAAECFESSAAILRLADCAIAEYERMKTARGALDFEDLVVKTVALLSRADAARWVHYKLDRGLQHILVDEAQDTSPRQWQVVQALAEEFFAGNGASDGVRTIFAVGDEKQSIYSFQGAVPSWFSSMRHRLGVRARSAGLGWNEPQLHLSFRSVPAILAAVDMIFASERVYRGLSSQPEPTVHSAARQNLPGRVVLWPMIPQPEKPEPADWASPVDHLGEQSPEVQLANRIADTIAGWLLREERLESTGAPIRAGDVLILSRIRGAQTDAINRALKTRDVPIAGADRIKLTEHIAVMDLMALGRVVLLPEDDLSLAALLKSPLVGLDEDQLFAIAHGRRGRKTLWWALGEAAMTEGGAFATARTSIERWQKQADFLDPHAFYARTLGADGGRARFLRRLGAEAEDVLDEFLAQTLAFEEANTPSLEGFLAWLGATDTDVRRDTDSIRNEVRVMTVHGAKGLEAPIVFLVDNGSQPVHPNHDPKVVSLVDDRDGTPSPIVWARGGKQMPTAVKARLDAIRADAEDEYRRLLYVAVTRACDRLYICGTEQVGDRDRPKRWHSVVTAALEAESEASEDAAGNVSLEWRPPQGIVPKAKGRQEAMELPPPRPDWLSLAAPRPPLPVRRITPSTALAADARPLPRAPLALAGADAVLAAERGRLIHRLLQSLPDIAPEARRERAKAYADAMAPKWAPADRAALIETVFAVLDHADFAAVFAPGSRAEVEIAGRIGEAALSGRIDRLAVTVERVLIVDYKTNRPAPTIVADAPHDYVMQLALYRTVLRRLYPGKPVAAAILWTEWPSLMEIPSDLLDAAEMRAATTPQVSPASGDAPPP